MKHPIRAACDWLHQGRHDKYRFTGFGWDRLYKAPRDARLIDVYQAAHSWDWRIKIGPWQIGWCYRRKLKQIHGPRTGWSVWHMEGQKTTSLHWRHRNWRITLYMPVWAARRLGWRG